MSEEYFTKSDFVDDLDLDRERFDRPASAETVDEVVSNVEERNIDVHRFESGERARDHLVEQAASGETVMNGHSTTLEEIGFVDALERAEGFEYLGNRIQSIDDDADRADERRRATTADVYVDGVNAIAQSGELLGANALGNAVSAWPFAADRLVLVGSTNKIVPSWDAAVERIREFALPLEDRRATEVYGEGSVVGKLVSLEYEQVNDRTQLVLIEGEYGF